MLKKQLGLQEIGCTQRQTIYLQVLEVQHSWNNDQFLEVQRSKCPNGLSFVKLPSGKIKVHYGKSPLLVGKSTISMAIFNSKRKNYQRVVILNQWWTQPVPCVSIGCPGHVRQRKSLGSRVWQDDVIVIFAQKNGGTPWLNSTDLRFTSLGSNHQKMDYSTH